MKKVNLLEGVDLTTLPKFYETEGLDSDEKLAQVKIFNPGGCQTWYLIEFDAETREAYGYVDFGYYPEYGYFSIAELEAQTMESNIIFGDRRTRFGFRLERDLNFKPTKMSEIIKKYKEKEEDNYE